MRGASAGLWLTAGTLLSSQLMIATATAQTAGSEDLLKMQANAANVVMPTITYDNQRYSDAQSDHRTECRQAAGGVDLLHRRASRP